MLAVAAAAGDGGEHSGEAEQLALQVADLLDLMAAGSGILRDDGDDDEEVVCRSCTQNLC